jgi:thioredoxin reductase (NADPH)
MSSYLVDRIVATPGITVRTASHVRGVEGDARLERVRLGTPDGEVSLDAAGMFVFIGAHPGTEWLEGTVTRDEAGFLLTGPALGPDRWGLTRDPFLLETSLPRVFAVGDVRARSIKRIASAVGEGSIAVQMVHAALRSD